MPSLTSEKEAAILEALKLKVESVPGVINVITNEPLLDSKQDILRKFCVKHAGNKNKTEVVYLKVDFLGFEDSLTDGCEDNPVVFLSYNLHVFQGYQEIRTDGSTSAGDIKQLVINLRNEFLRTQNNARRLAAGSESTPLRQNNFIILDNDPLTGAYGHYVDLIARVEIL